MKSSRALVTLLAVGAIAVLGACRAEVSVGEKLLDREDLQERVATQLQKEVGSEEPPTIECPDDLKAEVDESITCVLSSDDSEDEYDVEVTVTEVDGSDAKFDISVAHEPNE